MGPPVFRTDPDVKGGQLDTITWRPNQQWPLLRRLMSKEISSRDCPGQIFVSRNFLEDPSGGLLFPETRLSRSHVFQPEDWLK